jgi:class 3 adenylate cyclase/tetratricopeptide (TPR) repeat protein
MSQLRFRLEPRSLTASATILSAWLAKHGLAGILPALDAHDVDLEVLHELSEDDLKEIGLTLGQRRRLQRALREDGTKSRTSSEATWLDNPPAMADVGAEHRHVSVMFVDLVGSTALAARTDPEEMALVISRFQDAVSGAIGRYGGHIAKFMGDGVLAYFGWPRVREDEVELALRAGLQALDAIAKLTAPDGSVLAARAGIASGWVVVGDLIGDHEARERTIVGDTPNLAARLQSAAQPGELIVSDATRRLAGDQFRYETLARLELKGYATPVQAYRVVGETASVSRFEAHTTKAERRPLVGRHTELSLLMNSWRLAASGEGQGVVLVGEAGIGKSRLTSELLSHAWEIEHRRLRFQCSPFFADTPLWPVAQQLRRAAGLDECDGRSGIAPEALNARSADGGRPSGIDRLAALMALGGGTAEYALPAVADLVGLRAQCSDEFLALPATRRRMLAQSALIEQVLGLASKQPILMVLEDAHWADPSTLELFELLLEDIAEVRVMVLITSRPDDEPHFARSNMTRLALSRLGPTAVSELIENVMAETHPPREMVEEIAARTDGVPLFIEEVTKAVMEALDDPAGGYAPIPASLLDSLMARLDRLPGVHEVVQIAACIGREFDRKLLLYASNLGDEVVNDALEKLLDAELIFRRGRADEDAFVFKHALVRDAAYISLLRSRRQSIHAAIVSALEGSPGAAPSLIGHHATEAGNVPLAVTAFTKAGREAARRSANQEAVSAFTRALDLVSGLPDDEQHARTFELQVDLSVPLIAVRGYAAPAVEALLTDALLGAERWGDAEQVFKVKRGLWNCIFDKGQVQESRQLAKELVEMAEYAQRGDWLRLACRALGSNLLNEGQLIKARAALERVVSSAEPWSPEATLFEHGENPVSVSRWYLAWITTMEGDVDGGLAQVDAAVEEATALALPIASAFGRSIRNSILYLRRDVTACLENSEVGLAICEEYGFPFWSAHNKIFLAWARAQLGCGEPALNLAISGVEEWKATGAGLHICTWNCIAADAALHVGRTEVAAELLEDANNAVRRTGEAFMLSEVLRLKGRLFRTIGETTTAIDVLRKSVAIAQQQGAGLFRLRAGLDLARLQIELDTPERDGLAILAAALDTLPNPHAEVADFNEARELLLRYQ